VTVHPDYRYLRRQCHYDGGDFTYAIESLEYLSTDSNDAPMAVDWRFESYLSGLTHIFTMWAYASNVGTHTAMKIFTTLEVTATVTTAPGPI
jgi:hypothetical protein